jgi:hypothetical protein
MPDPRRFDSAVGSCIVIPMVAVLALLVTTQARGLSVLPLVLLTALLAFLLWTMRSTYYVFADGHLVVRCGSVSRRIRVADIRRVRAVRSVVASPALSADRLELTGGFGAVLVSPRDRQGFLDLVRDAAPDARVEVGPVSVGGAARAPDG